MTGRLTIDADYLTDTLRKLLEIPSPSGYTDPVVRFVSGELAECLARIGINRASFGIQSFDPVIDTTNCGEKDHWRRNLCGPHSLQY